MRPPRLTRLVLLPLLAVACATGDPEPDALPCPESRPQICTREYRPVCAKSDSKPDATSSNPCTACADPAVRGWVDGPCPAPESS